MADILSRLIFASHQKRVQEDTVIFPLLQRQALIHAISAGPSVQNMSERFEQNNKKGVIARNQAFLAKNGFAPLSYAVTSTAPTISDPILGDITQRKSYSPSGTTIQADTLFTTLPGIPLIHKPADCPTAIILAVTKAKRPLIGIAHLGRPQVNKHATEATLEHLIDHYGCNPEEIFIGITPSIGPRYYFIKQKDQAENNLVDRNYWGLFAYNDEQNNESIIRIDILGKILSILKEYGIPDENIQAYGGSDAVDTYALASKNPPEAFSYRYAVATDQPERDGRIMVACQLQG